MKGIDYYILETNHVSRVYNVAIILYLQFVLYVILFPPLNSLYFHINISCNIVQCPRGHYFVMVPVVPIIIGITFAYTFHMCWISIIRHLLLLLLLLLLWINYGLEGTGIESRWGEASLVRPERPWGPPSLLHMGYRFFSGHKPAGAWRYPPTPI